MRNRENLEFPWSLEDTIENIESIRNMLVKRVRGINLDGKAECDVREINLDFGRAIKALKEESANEWIPVSERLPEAEVEVLIQTEHGTITTAMYEDGKMANADSAWNWTDIDFDYDEEADEYYIPEGWWEYRHYNPDDVYNNAVDGAVIAWMPLPEAYREEK